MKVPQDLPKLQFITGDQTDSPLHHLSTRESIESVENEQSGPQWREGAQTSARSPCATISRSQHAFASSVSGSQFAANPWPSSLPSISEKRGGHTNVHYGPYLLPIAL